MKTLVNFILAIVLTSPLFLQAFTSGYIGTVRNFTDKEMQVKIRVFTDIYGEHPSDFDPSTYPTEDEIEFTLDPFEDHTFSWALPAESDTQGYVMVRVAGGQKDGNSFINADISEASWVVKYSALSTEGIIDESETTHNLTVGADRPEVPDSEKTLWRVEGDTLDAKIFREGVDKVVWAVQESGGGGGGGGMTREEFDGTYTDNFAHLQIQAAAEVPSESEMTAAGDAARSAAEAAVTQSLPALPTVTIPTSSSIFVIESAFLGTINLDPSSNASIDSFCSWVKALVGWGLMVTFAWWVWKEFQSVVHVLPGVQQAKGNPVIGGTGAQATALIAAGLMSIVFIAVPATFWALSTYDLVTLPSSPFSGGTSVVSAGLYLFGKVFPYDLAVGLVGAAFVIRKGASILVIGVAAAVRYIVP